MRFFFIHLLIGLSIGMLSCGRQEPGPLEPNRREIINETPYFLDIEMVGELGSPGLSFELASSDTLVILDTCTRDLRISTCSFPVTPTGSIIFDQKKIQRFDLNQGCPGKAINTRPYIRLCGYQTDVDLVDGTTIYTYRGTQEDYNNAEDL